MTHTINDVRAGLKRIVAFKAKSAGSEKAGLASVARSCGMTPKALSRLINGQTKGNGFGVYVRIREAYKVSLANKIAEYQEALRVEEERDHLFNVWDFDQQIEELSKQLSQRKEQLINGNGISTDRAQCG